jgi:hypothetical protein
MTKSLRVDGVSEEIRTGSSAEQKSSAAQGPPEYDTAVVPLDLTFRVFVSQGTLQPWRGRLWLSALWCTVPCRSQLRRLACRPCAACKIFRPGSLLLCSGPATEPIRGSITNRTIWLTSNVKSTLRPYLT